MTKTVSRAEESTMAYQGKVAMISGAARGIGAATAKAFAEAGADVALLDVLDCGPVAEEIERLGRKTLRLECDVSAHEAMEHAVGETAQKLGGPDVFVANAAFSERGRFWEMPLEDFERTIAVTMWGPFFGLRAVAPVMIERGRGGAIVVTSSPHATVAVPGSMPYNMAKAAVDHMARTAAAELAPHRIRVNVVHPGWVDTPGERKHYSEARIAEQGAKLPWGRLARPDEIARGILFLASSQSEYITGSTLAIDGGITLPHESSI